MPGAPAPTLADPALRRAVEAALGEASTIARRTVDLGQLKTLRARNAGRGEPGRLEAAVSLRELDLGFNPLTDLQPLRCFRHWFPEPGRLDAGP